MTDINWGLLGPPVDIAGSVRAGFETGRALRLRADRSQAIAALADDPNSTSALSALAAIDPETAWKFDDRARAQRTRSAVSRVLSPQPSAFGGMTAQPAPSAFNTPVNAPGAPTVAAAAPGGVIPPPAATAPVAASQAPGYDMAALRVLYAEDPETAGKVMDFIKTATKEQREVVAAKYAAAVPLLIEAQRLPYEQRRAFIAQQAPDLMAQGWTAEELQGFDPSDANIRGQIAVGTPLTNYRALTDPLSDAAGTIYRDPVTMEPIAGNPSRPTSFKSYDANGNEVIVEIPGAPGFGPGIRNIPAGGDVTTTVAGGATGGGSGGTGGGSGGGSGMPLSVRNRNPGALKASPWTKSQPGYQGSDSNGFAIFATEEEGRRAGENLVRNYIRQGHNTPNEIVRRWAPVGPENSAESVANYVAYVSQRLGIGPDDAITGDQAGAMLTAKAEFESGRRAGGGVRRTPTGGRKPGAEANPSETRVVQGKTYYKVKGRWYDNPEGK